MKKLFRPVKKENYIKKKTESTSQEMRSVFLKYFIGVGKKKPKNEERPDTLRCPGYYEKIYQHSQLLFLYLFKSITIKCEQNMNKI